MAEASEEGLGSKWDVVPMIVVLLECCRKGRNLRYFLLRILLSVFAVCMVVVCSNPTKLCDVGNLILSNKSHFALKLSIVTILHLVFFV
jgi:hypothetical protein